MIVIDHQPNEWTLLRRDDEWFLEVVSGISHLAFYFIIKLDEDEVAAMGMFGRPAIQEIAGAWADRWLDAELLSSSDEIGSSI